VYFFFFKRNNTFFLKNLDNIKIQLIFKEREEKNIGVLVAAAAVPARKKFKQNFFHNYLKPQKDLKLLARNKKKHLE
jgi:hypothetical protein